MKRYGHLLLPLLVLAPSLTSAQGIPEGASIRPVSAAEDVPPAVSLVLHPAPEPQPALKYRLLPPLPDLRPGNAAVIYGKVTASDEKFFGDQELWEKIAAWASVPLEEFPRDEARKALQTSSIGFLDRAARCKYVDWQLPLGDEPFFEILLPELSQARQFARLLAAKARLHVAEGEFDEALHTLQTGYALGRHVGQGQTLIHGLVGIAISKLMAAQVETLLQRPGAPNLYWALSLLPDPLIDLGPGIEAESAMLYLSDPELRGLEDKDYSPEQWRERLIRLIELLGQAGDNAQQGGSELAATLLALKGYPLARRELIRRGYTAEQVEAMPVAKVILLHSVRYYEELRDEKFKWLAVPYWAAPYAGLGDSVKTPEAGLALDEIRRREVIPLASAVLPAIEAVHLRDAQARRTIAALRAIEAVRLYGAASGGRLPETLADVTQVPVPIDPTTGRPFIYRRTADAAVLESPGGQKDGLRYEITFATKGNR